MNRFAAIALLTVSVLGSACTGAETQPRDVRAPPGTFSSSYRVDDERPRGPTAPHPHDHAAHAHGSAEARTERPNPR